MLPSIMSSTFVCKLHTGAHVASLVKAGGGRISMDCSGMERGDAPDDSCQGGCEGLVGAKGATGRSELLVVSHHRLDSLMLMCKSPLFLWRLCLVRMCACVHVCVRVCVRVCVHICVWVRVSLSGRQRFVEKAFPATKVHDVISYLTIFLWF